MNVEEAARVLGINVASIRRLLRSGSLCGEKKLVKIVEVYELEVWHIDNDSIEKYRTDQPCTRGRPKIRYCF
jgi:hypothetical protein